ncbi:MAG: DinB family protein [Desulfobacterales bacterium]|nr:MAG: DinB family protein [Desulfobacterales bacterium]
MIPNIQEKFESLTHKRKALLQKLDSLSTDKRNFKAGPDKWSVVEVVEHLVIVEDDLLQQISRRAPDSSLDDKLRSLEKYKTVIKVMERDIPVDVPDERAEPKGLAMLDELLNRWEDIRKKLHELLDGMNPKNKDSLVYRHPFAGPLNIFETLHFFDVHFDNHIRHIDRILAQARGSA